MDAGGLFEWVVAKPPNPLHTQSTPRTKLTGTVSLPPPSLVLRHLHPPARLRLPYRATPLQRPPLSAHCVLFTSFPVAHAASPSALKPPTCPLNCRPLSWAGPRTVLYLPPHYADDKHKPVRVGPMLISVSLHRIRRNRCGAENDPKLDSGAAASGATEYGEWRSEYEQVACCVSFKFLRLSACSTNLQSPTLQRSALSPPTPTPVLASSFFPRPAARSISSCSFAALPSPAHLVFSLSF
ncbi:hypothetical protein DFH06DRAFT_1333679 [Mycena polygramma]|nr:hypothetical protein DFH06DRAFT_1333679 [Mycena polygramma]